MSLADADRSTLQAGSPPDRREGGEAAASAALTDNLVQQVADRVYAMLMADIAIERERQRPGSTPVRHTGG